MNYNFQEHTYPSSDGIHTIYAEIYTPKTASSRGIIQLCHGMIDYVGRYKGLADYLTSQGYILAGNHHLGHGKSATAGDYGFFAERDGVKHVLADIHTFNKYLHRSFPTLPIIIMGHSMGSFLARLYVKAHPRFVNAAIIHGTAGPNPALPLGLALAGAIGKIKGSHHKSGILKALSIGAYQKAFAEEGKNAWLTREAELIADHDDDPYSNFDFTASGYADLFRMLKGCNKKDWFERYPKDLPTLVISGTADPVGNYGKGPSYVYKNLLIAGCSDVTLKMYEGARHELFLESNRTEVFADLVKWLNSAIG